jgi:hypothetical protein
MRSQLYIPAPTRRRISIMDALALLVLSALIPLTGYATTWQVWQ